MSQSEVYAILINVRRVLWENYEIDQVDGHTVLDTDIACALQPDRLALQVQHDRRHDHRHVHA